MLHGLTREVRWHDVKNALQSAPRLDIALAVAFTGVSFAALTAYEILAVAIVAPGRVRAHVAAIAGAISYAISNLLGFSVLTGGALRYRIYAAEGLDLATVSGVFATSWVTLWAGLAVVAGAALMIDPTGVPLIHALADAEKRLIGFVLLGGVAAFLVWLGAGERRIAIRSFDLPLPTLPLALSQILAAIVDVSAAALACYVLLPPDVPPGFAGFFVIYVTAIAVGIISHTPGGLGAFEAVMMVGLNAAGRADVLAALLLYRLIYYVLPFGIAALTLAAVALRTHEDALRKGGSTLVAVLRPLAPPLAAGVAFIAGIVLLISGSLPAETERLGWLRDTLPLSLIEVSHLIGSVVGLSLLVIARGLYRRLRRAWVTTLALLIAGALASLLKGIDFEEAVVLFTGALILIALRSAFYRRADADPFSLSLGWMISILTTLGATVWIGFFAYRHVAYANELWWEFAWEGNAPRFLRAGVAVAVATLAFGLHSWLSWRRPPQEPDRITDDVRSLAAASPDTEANLALLGDKRFLLAPDGRAFIMYAASGGSLISMGDPIGEEQPARRLAWELREIADRAGMRCAFYGVGAGFLPAYLDMGLSLLKLGEVARVNLTGFTLDGAAKRDLRHARNRAQRDGCEFDIIPAAEILGHIDQLRAVSDAWMSHKQGREKHFAREFRPRLSPLVRPRRPPPQSGRPHHRLREPLAGRRKRGALDRPDALRPYGPQGRDGRALRRDLPLRPRAGLPLVQSRGRALRGPVRPSPRHNLEPLRPDGLPLWRRGLRLRGLALLQGEIRSGLVAALPRLPGRLRDPESAARDQQPDLRRHPRPHAGLTYLRAIAARICRTACAAAA